MVYNTLYFKKFIKTCKNVYRKQQTHFSDFRTGDVSIWGLHFYLNLDLLNNCFNGLFQEVKSSWICTTNLFKSNTDHDTLNRTKFNWVTWILCISCFYFFFPCLPSSICLWVIVHYMVSIQETLSSVYKIVNSRLHSSKELKCYLHRWDISCPTYYVHAMVVG